MAHYNTVFYTLAKILPRHEIDRLDRKYGQGDRRLIHYISPEDQHEYHFITNAMHLSAQTIADIYKERWQIELFLNGLSRI